MQTLITLILIQSKLPTLGFVVVVFLFHHPVGCDYIQEGASRGKHSRAVPEPPRAQGSHCVTGCFPIVLHLSHYIIRHKANM